MPLINIVYCHWGDTPALKYKNEKGEVWFSSKRRDDAFNISMSFYSMRPQTGDSIYVVEPACVQNRDYDLAFLEQYRFIFTWAAEAFKGTSLQNRVIGVNHPYGHGFSDISLNTQFQNIQNTLKWDQRKKEIVIIANNKSSDHESELYSLRILLADFFHQFSQFEVSWYGQDNIEKPYYKGPLVSKEEVLKTAKFSICSENCYHPIFSKNYLTEKMPDVWSSGAVPLYMGCYNIDELGVNKESYIDLRKFVNKEGKNLTIDYEGLHNYLISYDETEYQKLQASLKNDTNKQYGINYILSSNRIYEEIINSY